MGDWRRMGHEQRRRMGAPTSTLDATRPSNHNDYQVGELVTQAAAQAARSLGHSLGSWDPYGKANVKARCMTCGAEVRVPFSVAQQSFLRHEGQAVNPAAGTCSEQAQRHPNRKRGTR